MTYTTIAFIRKVKVAKIAIAALLMANCSTAQNAPIMGWSSWNNFRINIDEKMIREQADAMITSGLYDAGYRYINIDDGYFQGRDSLGYLTANSKFPSGMKALADYIHLKGLKAGIYTDAGRNTCGSIYDKDPNGIGVGMYGHLNEDIISFFDTWGFDFLKVDWCGGEKQNLDEETEYLKIISSVKARNSSIVVNICRWKFPGVWAIDQADSWRISGDIEANFNSIMRIIDINANLARYSSPGHYNDMDMLQVGRGMTYEEDKTHFSMWCMLNSPLLAGNDLRTMSKKTIEILTNKEIIALNQDPGFSQAQRKMQHGTIDIWVKNLGTDGKECALAFVNRSDNPSEFTIDGSKLGIDQDSKTRDLWLHKDLGRFGKSRTLRLPAHGTVVLKVTRKNDAVMNNGVALYDQNLDVVNAHGACLLQEGSKYYLFGEYKTDSINHFNGFSCYSSDDMVNWKFERIALAQQREGILGPGRIGERVKVMRCPATGHYIMFMHCDDLKYTDPYIGYAVSNTIDGTYSFKGPLLYQGKPIKRWDMGTFQDSDGIGYLLIHHGDIYRLGADYSTAIEKLPHIDDAGESPAMFKKDGIYYLLCSNLTSWERNDNFYFTAQNIEGPWVKHGTFAPPGSLTHNSQTTFVFPSIVRNCMPMFMGDRWSFPRQASAATYVWLPINVEGEKISLPGYWQSWDIKTQQEKDLLSGTKNFIKLDYQLSVKGEHKTFSFTGTKAVITGETTPKGGYARITIHDTHNKQILSTLVDFYSKNTSHDIRYVSPVLPRGHYTITIEATGENSTWEDKKAKILYGSKGYDIQLDKAFIFDQSNE